MAASIRGIDRPRVGKCLTSALMLLISPASSPPSSHYAADEFAAAALSPKVRSSSDRLCGDGWNDAAHPQRVVSLALTHEGVLCEERVSAGQKGYVNL